MSTKKAQGFTLIELLVVIIIIGILAAIALPAFLNQANKAKQSEAKTTVGSMNRAQQAYFLERSAFADAATFGELGLGIRTETVNYKYAIAGSGATFVTNQAQPVKTTAPIKAYVGGVSFGQVTETSEATTLVILCEAKTAVGAGGATGEEPVSADQTGPACPGEYSEMGG